MTDYTITAYPLAELPVPGWLCFFAGNDTNFQNLVFYVWLISDGNKTILVDAGPPPDDQDFQRLIIGCQGTEERSVIRRVSSLEAVYLKAGIKPSKIDYLLITQPITYLSGGLLPQYFPNAKVYISRAGMMELLLDNPGHPPRDLYFTPTSWSFLLQLLVEQRLFLMDGPVEVLPGITFETTGGHHPGSAAVSAKTRNGIITILETAFLKENIDEEIPIGVAENVSICRQAIRRYKENSDLVIAGHDNTLPQRFPDGKIKLNSFTK